MDLTSPSAATAPQHRPIARTGSPFRRWQQTAASYFGRLKRVAKRRRKLAAADVVVISHAKSGRTWLAAMISHVYHRRYGIPESELIQFDNFHLLDQRAPRMFFSHDNQRDAARQPLLSPRDLHGKKVILLVRDPRDITISGFFHSMRKARRHGSALRQEDQLFDYAVNFKMPRVLRFLTHWRDQIGESEHCLVVRYEDLRTQPQQELKRLFEFIEGHADDQEIAGAVAFGSIELMRQREASGFYSSDKLRPTDPNDLRTFKVRRGKVGGYRDHFDDAQVQCLDALVAAADLGVFGYLPGPTSLAKKT
jgi:hypothetical protein